MTKIREFKVKQNILNEQEEVTSITRILKPVNDLQSCKIKITVTTTDIKKAEDELNIPLKMGDSVFFDIVKTGKQHKLKEVITNGK